MANRLWMVGLLRFCTSSVWSSRSDDHDPSPADTGFESKLAEVHGTQLHYVRGGSGSAVVLLHGFPEDWFRLVLPRLAKRFTAIAVYLRGVGESAPSDGGYDAANLAEDIHQVVISLGLKMFTFSGTTPEEWSPMLLRDPIRALRGADKPNIFTTCSATSRMSR